MLRIEYDDAGQPGELIDLFRHSNTLKEVLEPQFAGNFRYNRVSMRIPGCDNLTLLHFLSISYCNHCAVRHFVALTLSAMFVDDGDFTGT